ncbi:MAG TPA: TonB-dependent receptor [Cyclobacteriaceae bacterium]|nr:TonB-dependent receptor [Cyclobacteriaceae bacterium]
MSFLGTNLLAQDLSQQVGGRVEDKFHAPLSGAGIALVKDSERITTVSDADGNFVIENVQPGRYALKVSFTGYQFWEKEVLVISSRPLFISVLLEELPSVLGEVEISASTMNEQPGEQIVSIEKTVRVPANFFDPARVITSYPGVMTANDQNNTIIVRGNSPSGLLWRINGLDVVNPNHLANAGTFSDKPAAYGGGVNIISAQLMDHTNFYAGSLPSRYGNALSGVVDMNLRAGDKQQDHYTLQASLIGLDFAAEGPLGKKKNTSFLVNYRSSTIAILSALGAKFGDEDINFQDLTFSVDSDLSRGKKLSVFGFYGFSKNDFEHKDATKWEIDKDQYDIGYESKNFGTGITFSQSIRKINLYAGVAVSGNEQTRDQLASPEINKGELGVVHVDQFDARELLISAFGRVEASINSSLFEAGAMVNYMDDELSQNTQVDNALAENKAGSVEGTLIQPYAQWRIFLSDKWIAQTALRYMYFTFNKSGSLEPRISLEYFPTSQSSLKFSYNLISQLQQAGTYLNSNKELEMGKSHRVDVSYKISTHEGYQFTTSLYYQKLFDIPIERMSSSYSLLNSIEAFALPDLISEGTGDNYGVEVLAEKTFVNQSYFILGSSWYKSSYKGSDEIKRDTRFDGSYMVNLTYGKEWSNLKKESQRTFGVSSRLLYLGGLRESPIIPDQNSAYTQYDESKAFENKLGDYFRLDLRLNWRKNKEGYTRTIAIDIQNVLNSQNVAYHYYDHIKGKVNTQYQLGIIPILVYRIEF